MKFLTVGLSGVVVLPLVVSRMEPQDIAVLYLFNTLLSIIMTITGALSTTYMRCMSYAWGGAQTLVVSENQNSTNSPNRALMQNLILDTRPLHVRYSIGVALGTFLIGLVLLRYQISLLSQPALGWLAWTITCLSIALLIWNERLVGLLHGIGKISEVNRYSVLTGIIGVLLIGYLVFMGHGLFAYGASAIIATTLTIFLLYKKVQGVRTNGEYDEQYRIDLKQSIWAPTWRLSLTALLTYGVNRGAGFVAALFLTGAPLASYLQALSMMVLAVGFSTAPFYSQLPRFSRLRSRGEIEELARASGSGVAKSLIAFSVACVGVIYTVPLIFALVDAKIEFPDARIWLLMSFVWLLERHQSMQGQIYLSSNKVPYLPQILSTGLIKLALMFLMGHYYGVVGIICAHGIANLLIMDWLMPLASFRSLGRHWRTHLTRYWVALIVSLLLLVLILPASVVVEYLLK